MIRTFILLLCITVTLFGTAVFAKTINVPVDQPTIQAAINAANNGDTVLVAPGTYHENINFSGKIITVKSSGGATLTIIDGGGVAPVATFSSGETLNSTLSGFTLQNGTSTFQSSYEGGGIAIDSASPTIKSNIIQNNTACSAGGGIALGFASPLIEGNIIRNNSQSGCTGGVGGGGISVRGASSAQIIGNVIQNNTWASADGGGISLFAAGSPLIKDNFIIGNASGDNGAAITMANDVSGAVIVQNLISGNSSPDDAGIFWWNPPAALVNNTITDGPAATGSSTGIIVASGMNSSVVIANNLVVAAKTASNAFYCVSSDIQNPLNFYNNDILSAKGSAYGGLCTNQTGMNSNISADPKFINAVAINFHLQTGSPAINAGDNSAPNLPTTDLDSFPRIVNSTIDMGAYEFFPTTISFSPSSLTFSTQLIGTTSTAQSLVIQNTGTKPLFLGIKITGDFLKSNNCPARVAPAASCTVNVKFKPTGAGTRMGKVLLSDNASASPQSVSLTGAGQGLPIVSLSTTSLIFGVQVLGTTSASKNVMLKNTGTVALAISGITASGDFTIPASTCGSSLAPQISCTISVAFKPAAVGTRTGTLTITDNASGSPHAISLSGTGTAVTLSPSVLNFSPQLLGTTSAARTTTLTNHSTLTLTFSAITITGTNAGDFLIASQTCGSSLAGNATCTVNIKFRPAVIGSRSATLSFSDNGGASPQIVPITGTGTVVTLSRSSITFQPQTVGTTSAPQSVTLTNHGTTSLHITSIAITGTNRGDFLISFNTCPPDLVASGNCTVSVEFKPTVIGTRTASLAFSDDGGASPQKVKLTGTGQ